MAKYKVVGIAFPGKIDLYPYGTILLYNQSDERLGEIYEKTKCSFIKPTTDAPAITIKDVVKSSKGNKPSKRE